MSLKKLATDLTNLGSFFDNYPNQLKYRTKAGPAYVRKLPFLAKSLPYGNDRPGGGSSGQPFIVKRIPNVNSAPTEQFPDFILRDPKNAINNRRDDLERITKFLKTTQGTLFIAKQELLSLQNPLIPGRPNRANPVAGLYNPAMTLAQVAGAGTGLHIEKQGLTPIFSDTVKYETVYKNEYNSDTTNRLVILRGTKIGSPLVSRAEDISNQAEPIPITPDITFGAAEKVGVSRNPNLILSYTGGPNVNLGGKTNIAFASNRVYSKENLDKEKTALIKARDRKPRFDYNRYLGVTNKALQSGYLLEGGNATLNTLTVPGSDWNYNNNGIDKRGYKNYNNTIYLTGNTFPTTYEKLTSKLGVYTFKQLDFTNAPVLGATGSTATIADFRKKIYEDREQIGVKQRLLYSEYTDSKVNRESRVGLGNPGKRTRNRSKLTYYDNATVDKINMLPLYKSSEIVKKEDITRDLVKFRFEVIDNITPTNSTFVHFRAFLGSITDGFTANWEGVRYVGRGEKFFTYNGFNRELSFTFAVHPQSRAEMKPLYQKLNYLATSLAPDYASGYMKGNIVRLTIGDYLYAVPGIITTLTYVIPEDAPWEIALTEPEGGEDTGLLETPKLINITVGFTPIHDFVPQLGDGQSTALITKQKSPNPYLANSTVELNTDSIASNNLIQYATSGYTKPQEEIVTSRPL